MKNQIQGAVSTIAALTMLAFPLAASAALDPAIKCQAAKLKLSGRYASCRLLTDAAAVKAGETPDYTRCDTKFHDGWAAVEAAIGGECPTVGDADEVQQDIVECIPSASYTVHFFMKDSTVSGLQFDVDYSSATGEFPGANAEVECEALIPGNLYAFQDREAETILRIGTISLDQQFSGPIEVARCVFINESMRELNFDDFIFTAILANDSMGNTIDPPPAMQIVVSKP